MKTTVQIPDPLLEEAKKVAARDGTTLRELVEAGLRLALKERSRRERFRLRDARCRGNGLQAEFREGRWDEVRQALYEGRGG